MYCTLQDLLSGLISCFFYHVKKKKEIALDFVNKVSYFCNLNSLLSLSCETVKYTLLINAS